MAKGGIGARLKRKEDDRHLRGRAQFVADLRIADTAVGDAPHDQIEHLAIERLTIAFTTNDFLGQHDMDPQ